MTTHTKQRADETHALYLPSKTGVQGKVTFGVCVWDTCVHVSVSIMLIE